MTRQSKRAPRPEKLEDLEDQAEKNRDPYQDLSFEGELFDNAEPEPPPQRQPDPDDEVRQAGLTGAAIPGDGSTEDDMTPETLFHEDGVRWPNEPHDHLEPEEQLTEKSKNEIGAGHGLDEAELGRLKPLDKNRWDGDPTEPMGTSSEPDEDYPIDDQEPERVVEEDEDR